jgi:hypothetical protein
MRCAIVQPSYIPWRGHFDLIRRSDVFVFYDDVQYDKRGWRNRNRIKTPHGAQWLTIPVHAGGAQTEHIPINAVAAAQDGWPRRHLRALENSYGRAPHFDEYRGWLEGVYAAPAALLADFTIALTIDIAQLLGIRGTRFIRSSELQASGRSTARLIDVLKRVGATRYLSGPSAKSYLDAEQFAAAGIALEWMDYQHEEYPQLYPPYDPHVTILDFLFMTGGGTL